MVTVIVELMVRIRIRVRSGCIETYQDAISSTLPFITILTLHSPYLRLSSQSQPFFLRCSREQRTSVYER